MGVNWILGGSDRVLVEFKWGLIEAKFYGSIYYHNTNSYTQSVIGITWL